MKNNTHTTSVIQDVLEAENAERLRVYGRALSVSERASLRTYLEYLMNRSRPGNWAFHKLYQRFGIDSDVSMDDFGEREQHHEN